MPKPSIWYISGITVIFSTIGIVTLYYVVNVLITLTTEISSLNELIAIDKGAYYLFGVGLIFIIFATGLIHTRIFKKEISNSNDKLYAYLLIGALALTFIIPQIIHFSAANHLENEGYQVCEEKSTRWLHVVTIVYTKTLPCAEEQQSIRNEARIY